MIATVIFALILFYCLLVLWSLFKMAGQSDTTFPGCADSAPIGAIQSGTIEPDVRGRANNTEQHRPASEEHVSRRGEFRVTPIAGRNPQPVAQTSTLHRLVTLGGWCKTIQPTDLKSGTFVKSGCSGREQNSTPGLGSGGPYETTDPRPISPTGWILAGSGSNEPLAPHCQVFDETANWDNFPRYEF